MVRPSDDDAETRRGDGEPGPWKRALAERLVQGRLPSFLIPTVHARIRRDPSWSAHYDLLRRVERAAAGSPAISAGQRALLKTLVFDAPRASAEAAPARAAAPRAVLGVSLASAAGLAFAFVLAGDPTPPAPDALVARGARTERAGEPSVHVGLKARCVDKQRTRVVDEAEGGTAARVKDPVLECPADGLIAFSLTNLSEEPRHVFVVGVASDGSLRWYAPFSKGSSSVEVAPGTVDRLLDSLADTSAMADDPDVALFALFSERPLRSDEVASAVARAKGNGWNLRALSRLPLDVETQTRIDLQRRPAGER